MNPYRLLRYRNDVKALLNGRLPQRLIRRTIYRHAFHASSWLATLLGVAR